MPKVVLGQQTWSCRDSESVLDCLQRNGIARPASCRAGVCQSCIMKATSGGVPAAAQAGLKPAWKAQGFFLPCVCVPTEDLVVAECDASTTVPATVTAVGALGTQSILRVRVRPEAAFDFAAGQFVSLIRPEDGLTRPYSIASLPGEDALELHVAVREGGAMSTWLRGAHGKPVQLRGPAGECFYQPGSPEQPLLLAGTGTGLAPLWGVLRAAIEADHRGSIHLYHAARSVDELYLYDALQALAAEHGQLKVHGLAADAAQAFEGVPTAVRAERLEAALEADLPQLAGFRVYLCGNPQTVQKLKKQAFLAGAKLQEIHSDPFVESRTPSPA